MPVPRPYQEQLPEMNADEHKEFYYILVSTYPFREVRMLSEMLYRNKPEVKDATCD